MNAHQKASLKQFLVVFLSLLDKEDKKGFLFFVFILMLGGFLSLLGVAAVIPMLYVLLSPEKLQHFPFLNTLSYIQALSVCVFALIFMFFLRTVASILILKKQTHFLFNLTRKIQLKTYKRYLYSSYQDHVKKNVSSLMSILSVDINTISYNIFSPLGIFLNEGITSAILFFALLIWQPIFTIFVVGGTIAVAKLYLFFRRKKIRICGEKKSKNYRLFNKCVAQSLGSFKETKLYNKESIFYQASSLYCQEIAEADSVNSASAGSTRFLIEFSSITLILILLLVHVILGYSSAKVLTLVSVFGVASVQLLPGLNRLMYALANIKFGIPSLLNLFYDQKNNPVPKEKNEFSEHSTLSFNECIRLDQLSFSYHCRMVLDEISLVIPKGKKVAFVGQSGAGKTTALDLILGLLRPSSGDIYIDHVKLSDNNLSQWQSLIGYIPQMIYIYDSDIRQNVAFGVPEEEIDDAEVEKSLKMAALFDFVYSLPHTIYTAVGENGIQLSGGQRQRIGIARALYRHPPILIMDEATAALDSKTEMEVTQALTKASEGRTIITVAHRMTTVENYDLIYFFDKGKIIASGCYHDLLSSCLKFKDFINSSYQ